MLYNQILKEAFFKDFLSIQAVHSEGAQTLASMVLRGMASSHLVDPSTIVRM
jgi:hypothetical protein